MFGASQNLIDDSFSTDTQTPGKPPQMGTKLGPNLGANGKKMSIDTVGKVSMTLKFVVDEVLGGRDGRYKVDLWGMLDSVWRGNSV